MESVHHLMKMVSGAPNIRPAWFFDTAEQGEGLNDIGTHLVDLVQWTLFPDQAIDYRRDVQVLAAQRWPTAIPEADFRRVTGSRVPGRAGIQREGRHARVLLQHARHLQAARHPHEAERDLGLGGPRGGGDTHFAATAAIAVRVEVRQTRADAFRPELYVMPADAAQAAQVRAALEAKVADLQGTYPGHQRRRARRPLHVAIPDALPRRPRGALRAGDVATFSSTWGRSVPAWERPNMLAKYYVTTTGTEMSRLSEPRVAPRLAPQ